ncbi:PE-PGRS family protein [Streptomyces sp. NPDC048361]|uniref:PE-PGRS family protein n=1 Tax=Streptomyces sp. NPDC048361 TaxID=3154720 RepID=UPI0034287967
MEIGEHWAYRARPKELGGALRRVEIVRVGGAGRSGSVHVRFLDGDAAGLQEWVSPSCLLVLWVDVDSFRVDDAAELALAEASRAVRGSAEFEAARMILGFVRPKGRLRLRKAVADAGVLELGCLEETAPLVGMDAALLRDDPMLHEDRRGCSLVGWPITERIARQVAQLLAEEILPEVDQRIRAMEEERDRSSWYGYQRRDDRMLDAEKEALHTVREWCGQEKAERHDELVALRSEVLRLGELVERAVKALRDRGHGVIASTIERDLGVHISSLGPDVRR